MSKLRGAIKNFSKSIQRSTFQAIKRDSSSDLRNRSVASQIVPLLLCVASIDKSRAIDFRLVFPSTICFAMLFYVIAFYDPSLALKSVGYYTISFVFRVSTDNQRHCDADYSVWLPANLTRPWTNADIPFRVHYRWIMQHLLYQPLNANEDTKRLHSDWLYSFN